MNVLARWVRRFGLTRAICVLLLFALVPLRILDPLPLEEVRLRTFDFYQRLRGRQTVARPVIIVDIDEASLKDIGPWPWPRTIVADLVTQLTQLGAAAIARCYFRRAGPNVAQRRRDELPQSRRGDM
jgi:adenylate cyclase